MDESPNELSAAAEQTLIQRAQEGDEDAFGEIVRAHHEVLFRRIVPITRNAHDAEDVAQDVWLTVWRTLRDFRGEAKFSTWLYSVATRRALDLLRKRQRWFNRFLPFLTPENSSESVEPASPRPGPRDELESTEVTRRVTQAIDALAPKHRAVLSMREIEGLSYEEIAQVLRCRPGTVMSRLYHARRLLAEKLKELPCE